MVGKDSDDSTNLPLVRVGRSGRVAMVGEEDEGNKDAAAFKRLMVKLQEETKPPGYLTGRGALDHDDVQYLKEQACAEEDAERLRQHMERKAFAAFKAAAAASASTSGSPVGKNSEPGTLSASPTLRVEPKKRSDIRQQSLLRSIVAVKPKRAKTNPNSPASASTSASALASASAWASTDSPRARTAPGSAAETSSIDVAKNGSCTASPTDATHSQVGVEASCDLGSFQENVASDTTEVRTKSEPPKSIRQDAASHATVLAGPLGLAYEDSDDEDGGG